MIELYKEISNKQKTRMTNAAQVIRIYRKYCRVDDIQQQNPYCVSELEHLVTRN